MWNGRTETNRQVKGENKYARQGGTLVQVAISAWLRSCTNEMSRTLESSCYMCPMNSGVKVHKRWTRFYQLIIHCHLLHGKMRMQLSRPSE